MRVSSLWCIAFWILHHGSADDSTNTCDSDEGNNEDCDNDNSKIIRVNEAHPRKQEIENLAEWIVALDGFINDNQAIDFVDDNEGYGVFATEDVVKGEFLCMLTSATITGSVDHDGDEDITDTDARLALALHGEMFDSLNTNPYVEYLNKLPTNQLPEFWSDTGKELLKQVAGNNLPPQAFSDDYDYKGIVGEMEGSCDSAWNENEALAYRLMTEYNQQDHMTPFFDLYNHRNGQYLNTEYIMNLSDDVFALRASRDIKEGEQIYTSFNECNICNDTKDEGIESTPNLFHRRGFVEKYPQHWIIGENLLFDVTENDEGSGQFQISFEEDKPGPTYNDVSFLTNELDRLNKVKEKMTDQTQHQLPAHEWNSIWKYHESLTVALSLVIDSFDPTTEINNTSIEDADVVDFDDSYFRENRYTCYDWLPKGDGFQRTISDVYESQYQKITFYGNLHNGDRCLDLDSTLQICSGYRPHYHEPFVHFPAVFLSSVRRVIFVGGGDAMLLHEVLKYPSLELVVGLELDQKVVRNSFKHFNTLPHFHDDRVEWWFGDATKSLNIIPKEYFGSFDLVMVDLSETVMSFTVTKDLDMLEALALLTKPDGIFVKNEHYFSKIQTMFDHTAELYLTDNPMICDQHFAMGSNKIEFMEPDFSKLDGIETLLYKPQNDVNDHFDMIVQYAHNDAESEGKCNVSDSTDADELPKDSRPGIIMILNAEQASAARGSVGSIESSIKQLLEQEGLSFLSSSVQKNKNDQSVVTVLMKEGFIIARIWEQLEYFAFDIHLWGAFEKLKSIKFSLLETVGSKEWSSYRVVVGGMIGSHTWESDKPKVGPKIVNSRDCDSSVKDETPDIERINIIALEKSTSIVNSANAILVLCHEKDAQTCHSLEALKGKDENLKVIALYACPSENLATSSIISIDKEGIYLCGGRYEEALYSAVGLKGKISTLYIDESASSVMIKRVLDIMCRKKHQDSLLVSSLLFIAPQLKDFDEERQSVLPELRSKFALERISLIEMNMWGSSIR